MGGVSESTSDNFRICLLVADEHRARVEAELVHPSYDLRPVGSLEELLGRWEETDPDLIVCEGEQAIVVLKAIPTATRNPPIIVVSDTSDGPAIAASFREGATDWIPLEDLSGLGPAVESALLRARNTLPPENLFGTAMESIPIGITIADVDGRIMYTNSVEANMHGYKKEELLGRDARIFAPKELWKDLSYERINSFRKWKRESMNVRKDGSVFAVQIFSDVIRNEKGDPLCIVTACEDISERKALQPDFYDSHTGLPTRELFIDRLGRSIKRSKRRTDYSYAVFSINMDRFKSVNDSCGREVGDQILAACARRIESCIRFGDTVGRLGGDRFAVLLEDIRSIQDAVFVAERIQRQLILPFDLKSNEILITASIGIVEGRPSYDRADEILKHAEKAMFRSKAMGRARHEVYDSSMESLQDALKPLETAIHRALDNDEFLLEYQPIVSVPTGSICGVETFVRWQHPERGIVYPQEFVPIGEGTGQIPTLENWVFHRACREFKALQNAGFTELVLRMNLSAAQLAHPDLFLQIQDALQENDLNPSSLELEISERIIPFSSEASLNALQRLNDGGVGIAVDDFGTGQTSLGHLSQLPIRTLKLDRSLIREISIDPEGESTVPTAIALAHELKLQVIAEGVETEEQLNFLRQHHCDMAQGYYFSPPVPDEKIIELLKSRS